MQFAVMFAFDKPETPVQAFLTFQATNAMDAVREFDQAMDKEDIFTKNRPRRVFSVHPVWGKS